MCCFHRCFNRFDQHPVSTSWPTFKFQRESFHFQRADAWRDLAKWSSSRRLLASNTTSTSCSSASSSRWGWGRSDASPARKGRTPDLGTRDRARLKPEESRVRFTRFRSLETSWLESASARKVLQSLAKTCTFSSTTYVVGTRRFETTNEILETNTNKRNDTFS
jgi:hypothetical protein